MSTQNSITKNLMPQIIKKVAPTLLYGLFLYPVLWTVGLIMIFMVEAKLLKTTFLFVGFLETLIVIFTIGIPLLWVTNKLIHNIEKPFKPKLIDHFRQSLLYYLMSGWAIIKIAGNQDGGREKALLILILSIGITAIITNAIYLKRIKA